MSTVAPPPADRFEHLVFLESGPRMAVAPAPVRAAVARPRVRSQPETELEPEVLEFFAWLCERSGLGASNYRPSVFRRRAGACMRSVRASSLGEARVIAEHEPRAADRLLNAMLVGVTAFFRDRPAFGALAAELSGAACMGRRLSALSLGCSSGAELYSVAMLLAEMDLLGEASLTGVDCRPAAVQAAAAGVFDEATARTLPPELRDRYTAPRGTGVSVREDLRSACRWKVADAFSVSMDGPQDLVLCRNLAIYLDAAASQRLWERLWELLRPGGLLMAGKAERPCPRRFTRVGPCVYRSLGADA